MSSAVRASFVLLIACGLVSGVSGCEDKKPTEAKPAASTPPAQPAQSAAVPPASAPVASATPPEPHHDCPTGASGEGSFAKPCEATGNARMMEVTWTGKIKDDGPSFRVENKSKLEILYGRLAVYFYDKAGKQLEVKGDGESGKPKPMQTCAGNIFEGPMKAGEKAVITFSCVKKDHVPEGTTSIEAEMQVVGFSDATSKKSEFYWRNKDLTPDARPKSKKK